MPISKRQERYFRLEKNKCECGRIKSKNAKKCWECYKNSAKSWCKGQTKETDKRLIKTSEKHKNEKNPQWKGNDVGLYSLHAWIKRRKFKPEFCEKCKINPPYDLSNISGKYLRDVNDFEWLCRSCHMKEDGRLEKARQMCIDRKINVDLNLIKYKKFTEKKSAYKIAKELNVDRSVIRDRLKKIEVY